MCVRGRRHLTLTDSFHHMLNSFPSISETLLLYLLVPNPVTERGEAILVMVNE